MDQAWEEQNHIPALIHDWAMAEAAPHFAWQLVLVALGRWVIPLQIMVSIGEVDVVLLEDGSPLERCGMLCLAGSAMAQFRRQRLGTAELILDFTAMAVGTVLGFEMFVLLVDAVWCSELPLLLLWHLVHVRLITVLLAVRVVGHGGAETFDKG